VFEDPAYYSRLETMVSDILTLTRSSTKQKVCHILLSVCWLRIATGQIESSFRDNGNALHIGLLSQRLLPRNVLATMDHWVRFAFLVHELIFSGFYLSDASISGLRSGTSSISLGSKSLLERCAHCANAPTTPATSLGLKATNWTPSVHQ
jgi:hypothetical protein